MLIILKTLNFVREQFMSNDFHFHKKNTEKCMQNKELCLILFPSKLHRKLGFVILNLNLNKTSSYLLISHYRFGILITNSSPINLRIETIALSN